MGAAQWPERGLRSRTQAAAVLAGAPLLAVAVALGVGALFVLIASESPAAAYSALVNGSVGSVASLAQSLTTAIPVILTGVGMGLAFRVGLFNLGGEGQMIFGALAAAVVGHALAGAPGPVAFVAAVLAGALAGAAWAILPGWWEAWFRVPLVVTTLLLNYIAALFATYLAVYPLRDKSGGSTVAQTAEVPSSLQLPIVIDATPLHAGIAAAVVLPLAVLWLLEPDVARLHDADDGPQPRLRRGRRRADAPHDPHHDGAERRALRPGRDAARARRDPPLRQRLGGRAGHGVDRADRRDARRLQPGADRGQRLLPGGAPDRRDGAAAPDRGAAAARQRHPGRDHPDGRGAAVARAPGAARATGRMSEIFDIGLVGSAIRLTSPILLAALGGLFTDRAGMFNISLEGQMLVGAFFGVAGLYWTQNAWAGLALGVVAATALSLVFGLWVVRLDGDAIIVGLAINLLAIGLTAYLTLPVFGVQGSFDDPALQGLPKLWGFSPLVYLGALLVPATWWLLFRHPFGVRLRAVGEDPEAAEGAGIDPARMKFAACTLCGVLCGLAGGQLALSLVTQWVQGHDRGARLHRARGDHARALAPDRGRAVEPAVRVRLRARRAAPGQRDPAPVRVDAPLRPHHPRARARWRGARRSGCARHEAGRARHGRGDRRRDRDRAAGGARRRRGRRARQRARQLLDGRTRRATRWWCSRRAGSPACRWRPAPRRRSRCRSISPASSTAPTASATSASPRPPGARRASTPPTRSSASGARRPASSTCSPSARSRTSASRCGRTPTRSRAIAPW